MVNSIKAQSKKSVQTIFCVLFIIFACLASLFTFSACKWSNKGDGTNDFDSDGNLRVTTPYVTYSPYSLIGGEKIIDDNSGSFTWDLTYYFKNAEDIGFDQVYLNTTYYSDSDYKTAFNYLQNSLSAGKKPVYVNSAIDAVKAFYSNVEATQDSLVYTYKSDSGKTYQARFKEKFSTGWYIPVASSSSDYGAEFMRLYAKSDKITLAQNPQAQIAFPDYEVVVDGKYFTFKVEVKASALKMRALSGDIKNLFMDGTDDHSLFSFSYRTGKHNNGGEFIACPKGMMSYYVDNNGMFKIRFNPMLEAGGTNRYMKVRALSSMTYDENSSRSASLYSSTVAFEAYALSFESYSPNSTTLDYGGLSYDGDKYYFAYEKSQWDTLLQQNVVKSLTGYFPEGRKVEVSRVLPKNGVSSTAYDYALQRWTSNVKAENIRALEAAFPNSATPFLLDRYVEGNADTKTLGCLETATTLGVSEFRNILNNLDLKDISDDVWLKYLEKNKSFSLQSVVRSTLQESGDNLVDTLSLISHAKIDGYKFYANYAKVRNFVVSGTFFAGDQFFSGSSQYLTDVSINLFYHDSESNQQHMLLVVDANSGTATYKQNQIENARENSHVHGVSVKIKGANFEISGLEHDDFLLFQKEGAVVNSNPSQNFVPGNLPYSFHSPLMKDKLITDYGTNFRVLDLVSSETLTTDRQDVGIIGTQYAEQSNLIVNLYQLTDNGDKYEIDQSSLKLLTNSAISYEIIKSVSSYEDENGYITTNVIISLILPSSSTLIGYNIETLNNINANYYIRSDYTSDTNYANDPKFTEDHPLYTTLRAYEASIRDFVYVDIDGNKIYSENGKDFSSNGPLYAVYYINDGNGPDKITSADIDQTITSNFITYKGDTYVFDHRTHGGIMSSGKDNALVHYRKVVKAGNQSDKIEYLACEFLSSNGESKQRWFSYAYERVADDDIKLTDEKYEDGRPVITVKGHKIKDYVLSGEANELSTIAKAYLTEMEQREIVTEDEIEKLEKLPVYVYYDVLKVGGNYFYTSPIGRKDIVTIIDQGTSSTEEKLVLYFKEISNFQELLDSGVIALGSDILKDKSNDFVNAIGASKIILNCYYYVKPLGSSEELLFKQYTVDNADSEQTTIVTKYYYQNGSTKTEYTGQVDAVMGDGQGNYSVNLLDPKGNNIDQSKYDHLTNTITTSDGSYTIRLEKFESSVNYREISSAIINGSTSTGQVLGDNYGVAELVYATGKGYKTLGINETEVRVRREFILRRVVGRTVEYLDENGVKQERTEYSSAEVKLGLFGFDKTTDTYIMYPIVGLVNYSYQDENNQTIEGVGYAYEKTEYRVKVKELRYGDKTEGCSYLDTITVESLMIGGTEVKNPVAILQSSFYAIKNGEAVEQQYYPIVSKFMLDVDQHTILAALVNYQPDVKYYGMLQREDGSSEIVELQTEQIAKKLYSIKTSLVRSAQIFGSNEAVAVLGKYTMTNDRDNPTIYPSFSKLNAYELKDSYILERNPETGEVIYYSLDYTTKNNLIEGFPGVTLLAGLPYPNPVLYFSVRHKAGEVPVINIGLDIKDAYYVEIAGTNIATEDSNLIRDFTTYSFKDTLTNLSQNNYIDKTYWVLDSINFNPVYGLIEATREDHHVYYAGKYLKYTNYVVDKNGKIKPLELTIQNVGMNDNDNMLYSSMFIGANGKYYKQLYMEYTDDRGNLTARPIDTTKDVVLWKTSSTTISGVPNYDIHSYTQDLDGVIYFNSGSSLNDNIICNGLHGISSGATNDPNGNYNYDQVIIAGVTFAYRTLASELDYSNLPGYQFDNMLNVLDAYDAKDAYFLTGKEGAIVVASPIVKLLGENGADQIYRFKEWKIYSRYNSEVLYYNRGATENARDRYNSIMRFSSLNAGYFVFLPVYERVFSINMGTSVVDGALNQGGQVNLYYEDGEELDVENRYDDEFYFANYIKTEYQGKEGYYYSKLQGNPYLYFTGMFDEDSGKPIFSKPDNIYAIKYRKSYSLLGTQFDSGDITLYYAVNNGNIYGLPVLTSLKKGEPGIVVAKNNNGQYGFIYNTYKNDNYEGLDENGKSLMRYDFDDAGGYILSGVTNRVTLGEAMNFAFTSYFYYDTITTSDERKSVSLYYDEKTNVFKLVDFNVLNDFMGEYRALGKSYKKDIVTSLAIYNANVNPHLFDEGTLGASVANALKLLTLQYFGISFNKYAKLNETTITLNYKTTPIAYSTTNKFTIIDKVHNSMSTTNDMYYSRYGSLLSGELVKDENGNIYSTQQFKGAYIDRDSHVVLRAVADAGYRFEGWYLAVYDEEGGYWVTTDQKVKNSEPVYDDEIIQAYKNEMNHQYYYITPYVDRDGKDGTNDIYYMDSNKTIQAIVPDRMLDQVRGYFINTGSASSPNYQQVYAKDGGIRGEYYYDQSLTSKVDTERYEVVELAFVDAIYYNGNGYFLNNIPIYAVDKNGTTKYYRIMQEGNIKVDGDTIDIKMLHSNLRYVAKFIEVYDNYIFAEDEDASGISIEAVYYYNNNKDYTVKEGFDEKDILKQPIRTDINGVNRTEFDKQESILNKALFPITDKNNASNLWDYLQSASKNYEGTEIFNKLVEQGFGSVGPTFRVNDYLEEFGGNQESQRRGRLILKSMYFDVGTKLNIVVRVKKENQLSMHSLGINSNYTLTPILYPTDKFIEANQKATDSQKHDYLYYIFEVTYNRDPENKYAGYIVHHNRGDSMAFDAIAGNYLDFYGNYFTILDNQGVEFNNSTYILKNGKVQLTEAYFRAKGIDTKYLDTSKWYNNIQEALYDLCLAIKSPGRIFANAVKLKQNIYDGSQIFEVFVDGQVDKFVCSKNNVTSNLDIIFSIISQIMKNKQIEFNNQNKADIDNGKLFAYMVTGILRSGQKNFVNLSTIPVYNFTIQTAVIDNEGDKLTYDGKNRVILPISDKNFAYLSPNVYVGGGTSGKDYLGAYKGMLGSMTYHDGTQSAMDFENGYIIDFESYLAPDHNLPVKMTDLPFAANSIVLFEGMNEQYAQFGSSEYVFAGWYEQKFNSETKTWSELCLMSEDAKFPYLSLATADTVIVGLYKRVVNLDFSYNEKEIKLEFNDANIGANGVGLNKEVLENGEVRMTGKLYFDAKLSFIATPVGGYRFDKISYSVDGSSTFADIDNTHVTYAQNNKETDFSEIILNGSFAMEFSLIEVLSAQNANSLSLVLSTEKITLVYVEIKNYRTSGYAPFDFVLAKVDENGFNAQNVFVSTGKDNALKAIKDSTNASSRIYYNTDSITFAGYFDQSLSGKLAIYVLDNDKTGENKGIINAWYVNGNTNYQTSGEPELVFNDDQIINSLRVENAFKIFFEYEESLNKYNEDFALSLENDVYYLEAFVECDAKTIHVDHTYSNSIENLSTAGGIFDGVIVDTMMTVAGNSSLSGSGSFELNKNYALGAADNVVTIDWNAHFSLSAYDSYIDYNQNRYVFVGWMYHNEEGDEPVLISLEKTIMGRSNEGYYEARYVRVVETSISVGENASFSVNALTVVDSINVNSNITLKDQYSSDGVTLAVYREIDNKFYALAGSDLSFSVYPEVGYQIEKSTMKADGTFISYFEENDSEVVNAKNYVLENVGFIMGDNFYSALEFNAVVNKGYVVEIKQTLYSDLDMTLNPVSITDRALISFVAPGYEEGCRELSVVLAGGSNITFTNLKHEYYFIGFYVNGEAVTLETDANGNYIYTKGNLQEDFVIEARFARFAYFKVASFIEGTNTAVTGFAYSLFYTDPKTGKEVKISPTSVVKLPAGIAVRLVETSTHNSNPFKFIGFALTNPKTGEIYSWLSNGKEAKFALSLDKINAINDIYEGDKNVDFISIGAIYQSVSKLTLEKEISIDSTSEEIYAPDGELSEELKNMLDAILYYIDPNGVERSINLGSMLKLEGIEVKKGTTMRLRVMISSLVEDRYMVESVTFTTNGVKELEPDAGGNYNIDLSSAFTSMHLNVSFVPLKLLSVSKELGGAASTDENIKILMNLSGTTGNSSLTLSDVASTYIGLGGENNLSMEAQFEEGYDFVGWYKNGTLVSQNRFITSYKNGEGLEKYDYVDFSDAVSIVARFVSTKEITLKISVDGSTSKILDQAEFSIYGNINTSAASNDAKDYLVKSYTFASNGQSAVITATASSRAVLTAKSVSGYRFVGFRVSNGTTTTLIPSLKGSFNLSAETTLVENCTIEAVYESENMVSYLLNFVGGNGEDISAVASLSNNSTSFIRTEKTLSFDLALKSGYVLSAVKLNGEVVSFNRSNKTYSLDISGESDDITVELVIAKTKSITVYISVDDISDATVLKNMGIDITKFNITKNGLTILFNESITQVLANTFTSDGALSLINLSVTYDATDRFMLSDTQYLFDGFYIFDGMSSATSVSPVIFSNEFEFVLNDNIALVAKFASNKAGSSVETRYMYEMVDGDGNMSSSQNFEGAVENNIATIGDAKYVFDGYYALVNDVTNGARYIKLETDYEASRQKFEDIYPIVVARFIKLVSLEISFDNIKNAAALITLSSSFYPSPSSSALGLVKTESGYRLTATALAVAKLAALAKLGYEIVSISDSEDFLLNENKSAQISTNMLHNRLEIIVSNGKISSSSVTLADKDEVSILEETKSTEFDITIKNELDGDINGLDTTVDIFTFNSSNDENKNYVLEFGNTLTISLPEDSTIDFALNLARYENFISYKVTTKSGTVSYGTDILQLKASLDDVVEIEVIIGRDRTVALVENDNSKGTASVVHNSRTSNSLKVLAKNGYMISKVEMASFENGVLGTFYDILENSSALITENLVADINVNRQTSESDSFGASYLISIDASFVTTKSVAIKVSYKRVYVAHFGFYFNEEDALASATKYYFEEDEFINLQKLEAIDFGDIIQSISALDGLDIHHFTFAGQQMNSSTSIILSENSTLEFGVHYMSSPKIKIEFVLDKENEYNTPTSGIKATMGGSLVASVSSSSPFDYSMLLSQIVSIVDENNYFDYLGLYKEASLRTLISNSNNIAFTQSVLESLDTVTEGGETYYVIYASFSERLITTTVSARYSPASMVIINGTSELVATATKQFIDFANGSMSYLLTDDDELVITYPYSLTKAEDNIVIRESGFDEYTDDPLLETLKGVDKFYEKRLSTSAFRFDGFYSETSKLLSKAYDRDYNFAFKDHKSDEEIFAIVKRLYKVEFASNFKEDGLKYSINLLYVDGGLIKSLEIDARTLTSGSKLDIISYFAEEGSILSVKVEAKATTMQNIFGSILATTNQDKMLSKIFESTSIESIDPTTAAWKAKLGGYRPVSKFIDENNLFDSLVSLKGDRGLSEYVFAASSDISFLADFYKALNDYRTYITSIVFTPSVNQTIFIEGINGNKKDNSLGYVFGFVGEGGEVNVVVQESSKSDYDFYEDGIYLDSDKVETKIEREKIVINRPPNGSGSSNSNFDNYYDFSVIKSLKDNSKAISGVFSHTLTKVMLKDRMTMGKNALNFKVAFKPYSSLLSFTAIVNKDINNATNSLEVTVVDKDALVTVENNYTTTNLIEKSKNKEVHLVASDVLGYFFKGFAVISSAYERSYLIEQAGGNKAYQSLTHYNFISYTEKVENGVKKYVSEDILVSGNSRIIAIYEPRVYVIDVGIYKYDEDATLMQDKMTDEEIESATIKGSLLAQHKLNTKLTFISYPFSQFVGFAAGKTQKTPIYYNWDTGVGIDASKAKPLGQQLPSNSVVPGEDADGKYLTNTRVNLYLTNVTSDMSIRAYYTALSYDIELDLAETLSTYVSSDGDRSGTQSYLTYRDVMTDYDNFINPSAGTYVYDGLNYGTNVNTFYTEFELKKKWFVGYPERKDEIGTANEGNGDTGIDDNFQNIINIDKHDPYVYVYNDYNGNIIGYPTRIASSLVKIVNGRLVYAKTGRQVLIAQVNSSSGVEAPIDKDESVENKNTLEYYGYSWNTPVLNKFGDYSFSNILAFVNKDSGTYLLNSGLLSFTVDGRDMLNDMKLEIDLQNRTIKLRYKIVATQVGFPIVSVKINNNGDNITATEIKNMSENKNNLTHNEKNQSAQVQGFNNALFEGKDPFDQNGIEFGNIDVKLLLVWRQKALPIAINIGFVNSLKDNRLIKDPIDIMNGSTFIENYLSDQTSGGAHANHCDGTAGNKNYEYLRDSNGNMFQEGELVAYHVIIVKNARLILETLNAKMTEALSSKNNKDLDYYGSLYGYLLNAMAGEIQEVAKIYGKIKGNASQSMGLGTGATGLIGVGKTVKDMKSNNQDKTYREMIYAVMQEAYGKEMYPDQIPADFLSYRMVDAYELWGKQVNGNFYDMALNPSDMLIAQCLLNEHQRSENITKTGWLGVALEGEKGYTYFRQVYSGFNFEINRGSYSVGGYTNGLQVLENLTNNTTDKNDVSAFGKFMASIFLSSTKLAGTYNRVITVSVSVSDQDFKTLSSGGSGGKIVVETKISLSPTERVLTRYYDWNNEPVLSVVLKIAGTIIEGALWVVAPYAMAVLRVVDGILYLVDPDQFSPPGLGNKLSNLLDRIGPRGDD